MRATAIKEGNLFRALSDSDSRTIYYNVEVTRVFTVPLDDKVRIKIEYRDRHKTAGWSIDRWIYQKTQGTYDLLDYDIGQEVLVDDKAIKLLSDIDKQVQDEQ